MCAVISCAPKRATLLDTREISEFYVPHYGLRINTEISFSHIVAVGSLYIGGEDGWTVELTHAFSLHAPLLFCVVFFFLILSRFGYFLILHE